MSTIGLIIEERSTTIGNFRVGRLLPFREKRAVGPFVFIDHMGPTEIPAGEGLDVPPHPHIGLSTLTYLFEGSILHKDSLGNELEITPGAVNWMTAGKGIVHAERTAADKRIVANRLHGLQIWIALPKEMEQCQPAFTHIPATEIPQWIEKGAMFKLIAGEALGKISPVPVFSKLFLLEIKNTGSLRLDLADQLYGESAIYILEGQVIQEEHSFGPKNVLVANNDSLCSFELAPNSTIYIFGGEPFPEERFIDWNFVASDKGLIEMARENWKNQRFPKVPGETEFVPLPQRKI